MRDLRFKEFQKLKKVVKESLSFMPTALYVLIINYSNVAAATECLLEKEGLEHTIKAIIAILEKRYAPKCRGDEADDAVYFKILHTLLWCISDHDSYPRSTLFLQNSPYSDAVDALRELIEYRSPDDKENSILSQL